MSMWYAALVGAAARLLLAGSGIGQWLAWRIEVSTAANSNLELREGLALFHMGISPYTGSSCRTPPLALWLYAGLADHALLYVLPNIFLDILTASLLHRLASRLFCRTHISAQPSQLKVVSAPSCQQSALCEPSVLPSALAWAYLLNPFTLAASAAGTTSSLESFAVVVALYGACQRRPTVAALGLAVASYMCIHAAVLLLPVACLLSYGPEDVATPLRLVGPLGTAGGESQRERGSSGGMGAADAAAAKVEEEGRAPSGEGPAVENAESLQQRRQHEKALQRQQKQQAAKAIHPAKSGDEVNVEVERQRPSGDGALAAAASTAASVAASGPAVGPAMRSAVRRKGRRQSLEQQPQEQEQEQTGGAAVAQHAKAGGGQGAAAPRASRRTQDDGVRGDGVGASATGSGGPDGPANNLQPITGQSSEPLPQAPLLPWRELRRSSALAGVMLFLLLAGSDLYLLGLPPPPGIQLRLLPGSGDYDAGGGGGGDGSGLCVLGAVERLAAAGPPAAAAPGQAQAPVRLASEVAHRVVAAGEALASCWAVRVYGRQMLLDDATPNVGQWWYLSMEVFDDTKVYMRLLVHSLICALAAPLAMRLGVRRPLALFLIQLLCLALLKPFPSVADLGLVAPLLLLLSRQQLAAVRVPLLLPASLALLCVLGPAMQRMWLSYESANSNFLYSITLVYGVWHVVLLGQVLGLTLRVDRLARGKERLGADGEWEQSAAALAEVKREQATKGTEGLADTPVPT